MLLLSAYLLAFSHASGVARPHHAKKQVPVASTEVIWTGYGGNAQHTAESAYSPSGYGRICWSASQDTGNEDNAIHYGSSSLTANTIIVPVKDDSDFEYVGHTISSGEVLWTYLSTYKLPPSGWDWVPPVSGTLLPDGSYAGPQAGGGVFIRHNSDLAVQPAQCYYPFPGGVVSVAPYMRNVFSVTPLTADLRGNVYYGIRTYGSVPNGMANCFAKMSETGAFTFYVCPPNFQPSFSTVPALSNDGTTLYVAENDNGTGASHLIGLSTATMQQTLDALLIDPSNGEYAECIPETTASPMVGPDGDVYFGVMGSPFYDHGDRGFLLHFDANLNLKGVPGAFGWDDTPSVVPASSVPSYRGAASYLLFCKYNNYADGTGGQGNNMVAVIDPTAQYTEPTYGLQVMKPVYTVLGVTLDPNNDQQFPNAVKEWCINSAAVDVNGKSIVVNSEDGSVYKLDLTTGTLTSHIAITGGASEAYTSTIVAKDGTSFAVSAAKIYAIRARSATVANPPALALNSKSVKSRSGSPKR